MSWLNISSKPYLTQRFINFDHMTEMWKPEYSTVMCLTFVQAVHPHTVRKNTDRLSVQVSVKSFCSGQSHGSLASVLTLQPPSVPPADRLLFPLHFLSGRFWLSDARPLLSSSGAGGKILTALWKEIFRERKHTILRHQCSPANNGRVVNWSRQVALKLFSSQDNIYFAVDCVKLKLELTNATGHASLLIPL